MVSKFRQIVQELLTETLDKVNALLKRKDVVNNIQKRIIEDPDVDNSTTPEELLKSFDETLGTNSRYITWVANQYAKGNFDASYISTLSTALSKFTLNFPKLDNKDIGFYKTPEDLMGAIYNASNKQTTGEKNKEAKQGAEKVFEDNKWLVIIPHTREAAIKYGKGTKWCTSGINNFYRQTEPDTAYFDLYTGVNDLYIFINKYNPSEKYQYWAGDNGIEFKDAAETEADIFDTILKTDENLAKFFINVCDRDPSISTRAIKYRIIAYYNLANKDILNRLIYNSLLEYDYYETLNNPEADEYKDVKILFDLLDSKSLKQDIINKLHNQ